MKLLLKQQSRADRGSMYNIKDRFGFRNVSTNLMKTFNSTTHFLRVVTEAFVCLLGNERLKCRTSEKGEDLLEAVATEIVELVYKQIPTHQMAEIEQLWQEDPEQQEGIFPYCFCQEEKEENMVECSGGKTCPNGQWFHLSCGHIPTAKYREITEEDWWCGSPQCRTKSIFCCGRNLELDDQDLDWIMCDNPKCSTHWFHLKCTRLKKIPKGDWFCTSRCRKEAKNVAKDSIDHVREYSLAVIFLGLLDEARRFVVRHGDGQNILRFWRLDMSRFRMGNHYNYVILGHRLLAGVNGYYDGRVAFDAVNNRTVNTTGKPAANHEIDLENEFCNKQVADGLKERGVVSETNAEKISRLCGSTRKEIFLLYEEKYCESYASQGGAARHDVTEIVSDLMLEYQQDKLFNEIPGRFHHGFEEFVHQDLIIQSVPRYVAKLKSLSLKIDREKAVRQ
ncbi:uncharacterized protein LOC135489911 [Lineus longissimus]|uniref:uncharacterized protein LOC135489911 n=1 Tax=Lineus longissimus TaxID=88925 RepID=UPI00315DAF55